MIQVRVIADSINPDGQRITTLEGTFNRYILAEFNTHRVFSRNSASSRAIPVKKTMAQVWRNPATPIHWGRNRAGMQAQEELTGFRRWLAKRVFLWTRIPVLVMVWVLTKIGLHKQVANRLLEPWAWHTVVFTSTTFDNFFKLRLHPDAQPEFQDFAEKVLTALVFNKPIALSWGDWHLPYSDDSPDASAARCAAVSYLRQGEERDPAKDKALALRLSSSGHWSPFEHPACAEPGQWGNFTGWRQCRKHFEGESGEGSLSQK
jgi:hypothetical protein